MTRPGVTEALRAEARRIAHSTWMGTSIGIRNTLDAIADAVCEAALAAAPKPFPRQVADVTILFETQEYQERFGTIRVSVVPEGVQFWCGGEMRWRSYAPSTGQIRTAAGDALAQAVEWRLKIGGVVWGGLASAVEAYRAADPEPWAREQVEGLVRAAKTLVQYGEWTIGPESLSHHPTLPSAVAQARAALRPFATIAEQDGTLRGTMPGSTPWPGEAPAAGAPAPNMSVCAHCGTWRSKICGEGCTWGVAKNERDAGFHAVSEVAREQAEQNATVLHAAPDPRLVAIAAAEHAAREDDPEEPWTGPDGLFVQAAAALERQAKEIAELRAAIVDVITYWDGGANRTPFLTKHAAVIARAQEEGE